ncbi:MAG: DnaJ domain-containing protein [Oxalobacteraceae bacterium]|nr:DnaJ domain-containing protein [Oxalobacteraceae bacterium]
MLGVDVHASLDEIKAAYKKNISMYHPDKVSGPGAEFNEIAQEKSKEIQVAYDQAVRFKS